MKKKPLVSRLRSVRFLVSQWRRIVHDSEVQRSTEGREMFDPSAQHKLLRFDAAVATLTDASRC